MDTFFNREFAVQWQDMTNNLISQVFPCWGSLLMSNILQIFWLSTKKDEMLKWKKRANLEIIQEKKHNELI